MLREGEKKSCAALLLDNRTGEKTSVQGLSPIVPVL